MDIKKIFKSKWVTVLMAVGAAITAYNSNMSEHKREEEFEDMKKRLSKLEEK